MTTPRDNRQPVPLIDLAPLMRYEIGRFSLTDRERTLATLIVSLTLELGIANVRMPDHYSFESLTGIKANHISETLNDLDKLMRVIIVGEDCGHKVYSLNPRTETWQCKPRVSRNTLLEALKIIKELNGVPLHDAPEPTRK